MNDDLNGDLNNHLNNNYDDVVNGNLDKLDLTVYEINNSQITEIDTVEELAEVDDFYKHIIDVEGSKYSL